MKTLLSLLILTSGILFANANTDWVDGQIKAIKPPRSGISHTAINAIKNPFIYVYPESKASDSKAAAKTATTTAPKPLRLSAVMNNVALINGTWYRVNDKVRGYTLAKIVPDSVLLTSGKTKKMLFVTEENPNIQIKIK